MGGRRREWTGHEEAVSGEAADAFGEYPQCAAMALDFHCAHVRAYDGRFAEAGTVGHRALLSFVYRLLRQSLHRLGFHTSSHHTPSTRHTLSICPHWRVCNFYLLTFDWTEE